MVQPFDLNLRHLRALSTIAAHGTMSAAAAAVSLSQPALTQGLAKLERQLGVSLFDRRPDGVVPTAAGLVLADRVQAAIAHLVAAKGGVRGGRRGAAHPVHLMTATQLGAFLALADAGSFVAAAEQTRVSQPALHRAVRDLERIHGWPLAERQGRGVVLSEAGRRLARGVRLAAAEIMAGIADVTSDPGGGGSIVIGAMPLSRARVLPRAIARFLDGAPRALIDVVEGSWRELIEPLNDGKIDLMVGALREAAPPGLEQRPLLEDRLVVVGRSGHPLAGVAAPSRADLARFGWIVGQRGTPLRGQWDALFGEHRPAAPIECGSVMVIRGILQDSDLLTLLSPDQVALELQSGALAAIGPPLADGMRTLGTTTRAGWRPTGAQQRFIALLEQAALETGVRKNE